MELLLKLLAKLAANSFLHDLVEKIVLLFFKGGVKT